MHTGKKTEKWKLKFQKKHFFTHLHTWKKTEKWKLKFQKKRFFTHLHTWKKTEKWKLKISKKTRFEKKTEKKQLFTTRPIKNIEISNSAYDWTYITKGIFINMLPVLYHKHRWKPRNSGLLRIKILKFWFFEKHSNI